MQSNINKVQKKKFKNLNLGNPIVSVFNNEIKNKIMIEQNIIQTPANLFGTDLKIA
jgi:hypothetical protein